MPFSPHHCSTIDDLVPLKGRRFRLGDHVYRMRDAIATGPFSSVFLVEENGVSYAMKVEAQNKCLRPVLKLDHAVLHALGSQTGFPSLSATGRTDKYKYIVMQLVGPDLSVLLENAPEQRFTPSTIYKIALQTLDRLRVLHEAGWLNRDVKAHNFAVGLGEESNVVYMLDFGLTRKYADKNGRSYLLRPHGPSVGTFPFAPLNSLSLCDQTPIDDIEGWLYMVVHLLKGCLPWNKSLSSAMNLPNVREWKLYCRHSGGKHHLFKGLPKGWSDIFDVILGNGRHQKPDYKKLASMVLSIVRNERIDLTAPFDWQVNPVLRSLVGLGPLTCDVKTTFPLSSLMASTMTERIMLRTIQSPIGTMGIC